METDQSTNQSPATDSPAVADCPAPYCCACPICGQTTDLEKVRRSNNVMEQALAGERYRATPQWVDASKWLPQGPHEVLATDGEGSFIAFCNGEKWWLHELDEPCDSEVTHWMELPEIPEV